MIFVVSGNEVNAQRLQNQEKDKIEIPADKEHNITHVRNLLFAVKCQSPAAAKARKTSGN